MTLFFKNNCQRVSLIEASHKKFESTDCIFPYHLVSVRISLSRTRWSVSEKSHNLHIPEWDSLENLQATLSIRIAAMMAKWRLLLMIVLGRMVSTKTFTSSTWGQDGHTGTYYFLLTLSSFCLMAKNCRFKSLR